MNYPSYEYRRSANHHQIFEAETGCVASFLADEVHLNEIKGFCLLVGWDVENWPDEMEALHGKPVRRNQQKFS